MHDARAESHLFLTAIDGEKEFLTRSDGERGFFCERAYRSRKFVLLCGVVVLRKVPT
eukprot:SAG11_NODE_604_length_8248_cov_6.574251_1_plen_57_part_00